jgi:hypothetical protein
VKQVFLALATAIIALLSAAQSQPTTTEPLPIYEKLRSAHKLPKWAETACFFDGMHDQLFFVIGADGGRWNVSRIGGIRLRHYSDGVVDGSEIHLKLDHTAETGPSKYFFSEPYKAREGARHAWQLVIDWDTNRFRLMSISVNMGKSLFDESGHCMEVNSPLTRR